MKYRELAADIERLSEIDKDREVEVYPPEQCPATDPVPVTELQVVFHKNDRTNTVRLLTGKSPGGTTPPFYAQRKGSEQEKALWITVGESHPTVDEARLAFADSQVFPDPLGCRVVDANGLVVFK